MLDDFIIYSLSVYWFFHLVSRSDIMETPRNWAFRVLPYGLSYPLTCAYCMTFWLGLIIGMPVMDGIVGRASFPICLFAAPVFNLFLDLGIRSLIKKNEEPTIRSYSTTNGTSYVTIDPKP